MDKDLKKDICLNLEGYVNVDENFLESKAVPLEENHDRQYFLKEGNDFYLLHRHTQTEFLKMKITSEMEIIDEEFILNSQFKDIYERLKPKLLKYKLEKLLNDA